MAYRNTVEFELFGDYALFPDPVMRVGGEKCTLQIPTYEALKGALESAYWKPTIVWVIDSVRVMNPIQTAVKGIRRMKYEKGNDLSYYTYLKNCRYQVRAHFEWNMNRPELAADRNENKHHNIAKRMIEHGGRRDIFLGARECQGYIVPCVFGSGKGYYDDTPELAFGLTYHGLTYADEAYSDQTEDKMTVRFWYPVMRNGVLEFVRPEDCSIIRTVREMEIKPFGAQDGNFQTVYDFEQEVL